MAAEKKYEPYLAGVGSRADLNYLFEEAMGNLTVGHLFVRGGAPLTSVVKHMRALIPQPARRLAVRLT